MKKLMTIALLILAANLQAKELSYIEGEELVKSCQRDYYNCIATHTEIADLRLSLLRNAPAYLQEIAADQAEETLLAGEIQKQVSDLSQLVLSKASKKALTSAQTTITKYVSDLKVDQESQHTLLEKRFAEIVRYFEVMEEFSENYYKNLATITSDEVRETYVSSGHNRYRYILQGLNDNLKATKKGSAKLLENNCKFRMSLSSLESNGHCGTYSFNPFTNLDALKFMVYNKVGKRSLPLKFSMVKKSRRSDAVYSKDSHSLTLYYYTWTSWGWYGDSGTAAPSKEEVNKAIGLELLK